VDLDALSESARNRGLKLVRSRIRTPTKRGFGKVGLVDGSGKPLFGIEGELPKATPEEVQAYLRNLDVADWGASLGEAERKPPKRVPKAAANDSEPLKPTKKTPAARPKPPPAPAVRQATAKDAPRLLPLLRLLGYSLDERAFSKRLVKMITSEAAPLVAALGHEVVGLCGLQVSTMLQREKPVGRITVLVVAEDQRGKAIGRMLLEAAEAHFRSAGCELMEVTSNDKHLGAHAFYRRIGLERTSIRFAKGL
jgi:ribosomal protein S18 acetylase RimI-like enzyme